MLPSYQQADLRDPVGLPLSEVWLGVTVEPTDFAGGKQWPPRRAAGRAARFRDQHQAARGDYTAWLPTEYTSASNPIGAYVDEVRALMLASAPGEEEPVPLRKQIRRAIGRAVADIIKHGRCVAYGNETAVTVPDIRYAWPFSDGGWGLVIPQMAPQTVGSDYGAAVADVWMLDGTTIAGERRHLDAGGGIANWVYGRLGDVVDVYGGEPARVAWADRPDVVNGWGTPADDLIPLAVDMARRESGVDYAVDRNERPAIQLVVAEVERNEYEESISGEVPPLATEDMALVSDATYRNHNVLAIRGRSGPGRVSDVELADGSLVPAARKAGRALDSGLPARHLSSPPIRVPSNRVSRWRGVRLGWWRRSVSCMRVSRT